MTGNEVKIISGPSEAQPFLRHPLEGMSKIVSADSDSSSCGDGCECGSGASGCAFVPEQPKQVKI